MDFSLVNCWDCPSSIDRVLPILAVALLVFAVAVLLLTFRPVTARAAGGVLLVLAALIYFFGSFGIVQYGVSWSTRRFVGGRPADIALLLAWYALSVAAAVAVIRFRRDSRPVDAQREAPVGRKADV